MWSREPTYTRSPYTAGLDTTDAPFPRILTEPSSLSVFQGGTATFRVAVTSPSPESYQWFFGCWAIADATNAALTVTDAITEEAQDNGIIIKRKG